jgi:hypothetical protein
VQIGPPLYFHVSITVQNTYYFYFTRISWKFVRRQETLQISFILWKSVPGILLLTNLKFFIWLIARSMWILCAAIFRVNATSPADIWLADRCKRWNVQF